MTNRSFGAEYIVETLEDLNILEYVATHTEVEADWAPTDSVLFQIGDLSVADLAVWRSPLARLCRSTSELNEGRIALFDHRRQ